MVITILQLPAYLQGIYWQRKKNERKSKGSYMPTEQDDVICLLPYFEGV